MDQQSDYAYELFISYADADRAWVEGYLFDALRTANVSFQYEAAFDLGTPRLLEFEHAIQQCKRALLILSPAYLVDGASEFFNLLAQTYGLESATWQVIPLILQPVRLPPRLGMLTALDATEPDRYESALQRLLDALQYPLPASALKPNCPYPGMVPFGEEDSTRFFGRGRDIENLLQRLRLHPFLTVIGPSGSGKSSLVFAGMVPALRKSSFFGDGAWIVKSMRPGEDPLGTLSTILGQNVDDLQATVAKQFQSNTKARHFLLIVDQFEEIFTVAKRDAVEFQDTLRQLTAFPDCFVVITVRADFYADLMISPLWSQIQAHRAEVLPLDEDRLQEAIVRPAEDVGVFVETALVERLLADAAGEPGILPLIQETFVLLWDKVERRYLPLRAYDSLILPRSAYDTASTLPHTGLQVAISLRADSVYGLLNSEQQAIARRILLRLIQFGEGRADTRRQQTLAALRSSDDDSKMFEETLHHLTENRLLTMTGDETGAVKGSSKVDIAHEALIIGWPLLQAWLYERRDAEQVRRRLENYALEWVRLGRGDGGLLDEVQLLEAERWLSSSDASELGHDDALPTLVEASRRAIKSDKEAKEEQQRREYQQLQQIAAEQTARAQDQAAANKKLKQRARVLAGVSVVAALLTVMATFFAREANRQSAEAELQSRIALSRQLAVQASTNLDTQYDLALLLSAEAKRNEDTQEAQASQLRVLLFNEPLQAYLFGHSAPATSVAFSADNRILASGDESGTLILWNVGSHSIRHQIKTGHHAPILRLAFSPDGKFLISISYGNRHISVDRPGAEVMLWDVTTGDLLKQVAANATEHFTKASVSSNAAVIAFVDDSEDVVFWDAMKDAYISRLSSLGYEPSLALDQKGNELIWVAPITTQSGNVVQLGGPVLGRSQVLEPSDSSPVSITGHANLVDSIALSSDSSVVATASYDGSVLLFQVGSATPIAGFKNSNWPGAIEERGMAFKQSGELFAFGDGGGAITIYDVSSNQTWNEKLRGHSGDVLSLAFAHDSSLLASGGQDGKVILWELDHKRLVQKFDNAQSIIFDQTGNTLAVIGDGKLSLYDSDSRSALGTPFLVVPSNRIWKFFPDGRRVVTSDYPGGETIFVWDTKTGSLEGEPIPHPTYRINEVNLSPDGKHLATTSSRGDTWIFLRELPTLKMMVLKYGPTAFTSIDFSPDSLLLGSGTWDGKILIWDLATYTPRLPPWIGHNDWVSSMVFSPDGKYLASGGADRVVKLWDITNGKLYGTPFVGHTALVRGLAFSSDGSILASVGDDDQIILWDIKTSKEIGRLPADGDQLMFDPRPRRVVLANGSRLWTLESASWSDLICRTANRNLSYDEWNRFVGASKPYQLTCPDLPVHPSLFAHARELASTDHEDEALIEFEHILELDPSLSLDPEAEVRRLSAEARANELIQEARTLALHQEIAEAVSKFQEAVRLSPSLNLDPSLEAKRIANLVSEGVRLAQEGQIKEAIAAFDEARSIDLTYKISSQSWNQLCRNASLWGYAWDIANSDACDLAVELAENNDEEARGRDSRGIAFVLANWDYETAGEDFRFYVEWSKKNGLYEEYGRKRESWIQKIEAGEVPFDESILQDLRNE